MSRLTAIAGVTCLLACLALPVVAQPAPPAYEATGVRVSVPQAHVALTIPLGWSVTVDHHPSDPPPGQSTPAEKRWSVLSTAAHSDELDGCRLLLYETSGSTLEEFATGLLGPTASTITPVALDSGDAIRLDLDLGGPESAQQYLLGSGSRFYQLACVKDEEPPDPRWLAIAQSIELLPAQE